VASLSQGRTAAAQCGLFTHKSVPVIFEPPCTNFVLYRNCTEVSRRKTITNPCDTSTVHSCVFEQSLQRWGGTFPKFFSFKIWYL